MNAPELPLSPVRPASEKLQGGGTVPNLFEVKESGRSKGAGAQVSLLRALPRTGRLHQIRVHLASIGHPVLGDKLYQFDGRYYLKAVERTLAAEDLAVLGMPRQMLHAHRLTIKRPGGAPLEIKAPIPADFADAIKEYGLSDGPSL